MTKQAVLVVFVLLGSFAAAQTSEEVRQEKLEYRHAQTPLETSLQTAQATSFEEEMKQAKLEVHTFRVAQRRDRRVSSQTLANETVMTEPIVTEPVSRATVAQADGLSEAKEMKQVKQDYRAFSSAQHRQRRVTVDTTP